MDAFTAHAAGWRTRWRHTSEEHTRNGAAVWMDGAVESSGLAYVKNKAQWADRVGEDVHVTCRLNADCVLKP